MHNALANIAHGDVGHAELGPIGLEHLELQPPFGVFNVLETVGGCGEIMIGYSDGLGGACTLQPAAFRPSNAWGEVTS